MSQTWATLCELDELVEDQGHYAEIDGYQLAVFLSAGVVYAMANECPHAGGSMSSGHVENGCAICPWHAWGFDLKTGKLDGAMGDAEVIKTYPTRIIEHEGRKLVQAQLTMP